MLVRSSSPGVKMDASPEVRKPLRARKTMTPSSRRQMKMLRKAKEGAQTVPPMSTNSDVNQFLNIGALQDILYSWYESESSSPLCKPVEVHLNEKPAAWTLGSLEARLSSSPPAVDTPSSSSETNASRMVSQPETAAVVLDNPHNNAFCKRKRISEEAREGCQRSSDQRQSGLRKIKGFIQEQLVASMKTLDHKLQHLHERIDHLQCLRKHEGTTMKVVNKISRLNKRINSVIALQKKELSSRVNLPGVSSQNKILNCPTTLPGNKSSGLRPSEEVPSGPRKMPPETTKERSDDVICLDEVNTNPGMAAVNPPAVHQKETRPSTEVSAAAPSASKYLLIDLTDEESNPNTGNGTESRAARRNHSAREDQNPSPLQPELQPVNQAGEDFAHLPPLPKSHLHPEPVTGFQGTLPPQKLDLSVVRVENPKGIAMQWNIQRADPRCAPLESFHLFLFLEGGLTSSWQETNQIQAKKLPMACTATSFPESTRIYLAMRAKDIYGRYGPFSDIQSILTL